MNKILKALLALNIAFVGSIFARPMAVITYIKNDTNQPLVIYGQGFQQNIPVHQATQTNIEIPLEDYYIRGVRNYRQRGEIVITPMGIPGGINLEFFSMPYQHQGVDRTIIRVELTKNRQVIAQFSEEFDVPGDNASYAIQLQLTEDAHGNIVPVAEELDVTPIIH